MKDTKTDVENKTSYFSFPVITTNVRVARD